MNDFQAYRAGATFAASMAEIPFSIVVPLTDWARIRKGKDAKEMEDRWVIGFAPPYLEFFRSWTATLVFKLAIEQQSDGSALAGPPYAAHGEDWYTPQPPEKEAEMVRKTLKYSFGFTSPENGTAA